MAYTSDYPIFAVTADVVLLAGSRAGQRVLLIRRARPPYQGMLALPGGFVDIDEDLPAAALRELEEETGVHGVGVRQLGAYGAPDRDPRGRTVGVAFWAYLAREVPVRAGDDAASAGWYAVKDLLDEPDPAELLAFDHAEILRDARVRAAAG